MIAIAGAIAIGLPITEATLITRTIAVAEAVAENLPASSGGEFHPPLVLQEVKGRLRQARQANAARGLSATNTNKFYCN